MRNFGAIAWVLTGLLWVMAAVTTIMNVADDLHGLIDLTTAIAAIVAACLTLRAPQLQPGAHVTTDEEISKFEESVRQGYREAADGNDGPRLRSAC